MRGTGRTLVLALVLLALGVAAPTASAEPTLPPGFQDTIAIEGLSSPTAVRFAPDGEVFVAQKGGQIFRYDNLGDETPTLFADLRKAVYDYADRGLLGLAVDPQFPARPYVYALYTFDHVLGEDDPGEYPHWGKAAANYENDSSCVAASGGAVDACPVSGRLVRLTAEGGKAVAEKPLLEDWCQQFSSHSIGGLQFGPEGALFASGGDGASFLEPDYGQFGWPHKNQCGDPPGGEGLKPPSAAGGSLRSQDLLTPYPADPTGLAGSLIRIDPDSGAGLPGNPLSSSLDANERRIVGYGFRNPFRFAIDPESAEVYVNNVGNGTDEEIDRFPLTPSPAYNSGWPCYEGTHRNPDFDNLDLNLCEGLYGQSGAVSQPFFHYRHGEDAVPGDPCPSQFGSAITGSAIYPGGSFPEEYDGALFFADSVRGCIYVLPAAGDEGPDPDQAETFLAEGGPYTGADIEVGPGGDLYYLSLYGDEAVHRISYDPTTPVARLSADKQWGALPLKVKFDAGASEDPGGGPLSFDWDLDGDGDFEVEGGGPTRSAEYKTAVNRTVTVRAESQSGATDTAAITVYPGDTPPAIEIDEPAESLTWRVGQQIKFSGSAIADGGNGVAIPQSGLFWRSSVLHCPGGESACHAHPLPDFSGVSGGEITAPDHDLPSRLRIVLTATDSRGLAAAKTIELYPRTVTLAARSDPPGATLSLGSKTGSGPLSLPLIEGANTTLSAPPTTEVNGVTYGFASWSDGGPRVHSVLANSSTDYIAFYSPPSSSQPPGSDSRPPASALTAPRRPELKRRPPARTTATGARFEFGSVEPGVGFACKLDERELEPCGSPRVYKRLKLGKHVFRVYAEAPGESIEYSPATVFRWRVLATESR